MVDKFFEENWQWIISLIFVSGTLYASFRSTISELRKSVCEIKTLTSDMIIMKERMNYCERMIEESKEIHKELTNELRQVRDSISQLASGLSQMLSSEHRRRHDD